MSSEIDRTRARRWMERLLERFDERRADAGQQMIMEVKDFCWERGGLSSPGNRPGLDALALGGVARELADSFNSIEAYRGSYTLVRELADMLAVRFRALDPDADRTSRRTLLQDLWSLMSIDLENGSSDVLHVVAKTLKNGTTDDERQRLETWFRSKLESLPESGPREGRRSSAGRWFLHMLGDDIADEEYEGICRELSAYPMLAERLLDDERFDAAFALADEVPADQFGDLVRLFDRQGVVDQWLESAGMPERGFQGLPARDVLDVMLVLISVGRIEEALPWMRIALQQQRLGDVMFEVRDCADENDVWGEELEEALLDEVCGRAPEAAVEFFLEFGDIESAFAVFEREELSEYGHGKLRRRMLARAREEGADDVAISLLTERADEAIAERGRSNYVTASSALARVRELLEDGELPIEWPEIRAEYEDRMDQLPAFRDEMEKAGLV